MATLSDAIIIGLQKFRMEKDLVEDFSDCLRRTYHTSTLIKGLIRSITYLARDFRWILIDCGMVIC